MKKMSIKFAFLILCLYVYQFSGTSFFLESFISILRKDGLGLQYLGMIYMLGLFIVFKFLWAPIVEKISFGKFGHYRGWIFITQTLMICLMIAISFCNIKENLGLIVLFAAFYCFFASLQYVAIDGFIYKILAEEKRASVNSIKMAGIYLGMIIGGGGGLILYSHIGWQDTILIFIIFAFITLVILSFQPEVQFEKKENLKPIGLRDFFRYWALKERRFWLFILLLAPVSISVFFGLTTRILVDIGWALEKIGIVVNMVGYILGSLFSFFVPFLISKFGKRNIFFTGLLGQAIGLSCLLFILNGYNNVFLVAFIVTLSYMFYSLVAIVTTTLMMDKIKSKTPAFEYALQHSIYSFAGMLTAGMSMFMAGFIGYEKTVLIGVGIGLLSAVFSRKVSKYSN